MLLWWSWKVWTVAGCDRVRCLMLWEVIVGGVLCCCGSRGMCVLLWEAIVGGVLCCGSDCGGVNCCVR